MRVELGQVPTSGRARSGLMLAELLSAWQEWPGRTTLLSYRSIEDEIDTAELHRRALLDGKTLALPRISGRELHFHRVEDPAALRSVNRFGIPEPDARLPTVSLGAGAGVLVLVPGMAFDPSGHRLGRGAGYYDRFLPTLPAAVTVGVCYDFQLIDAVPAGARDARVQWIATDRRIRPALPMP